MCINFLPVWLAHKLRCKITTKIAYMQVFKKKRWKALVQLIILLYLCGRFNLFLLTLKKEQAIDEYYRQVGGSWFFCGIFAAI